MWDDGSNVALPEPVAFVGTQMVDGAIFLIGGMSPATPGGSSVGSDHVWRGTVQ